MRIRAFLALNFSIAVTRRIAEEIERRKAALKDARVAWVPAANLHVTLKFLGSTAVEVVEAIGARLAHRLPAATLKRIFAGLLYALATKMAVTYW